MAGNIPLLLFTGMVADERLFEGQIEAFDNVVAPRWIDARPNESIRAYARRMVASVGLRSSTRSCANGWNRWHEQ